MSTSQLEHIDDAESLLVRGTRLNAGLGLRKKGGNGWKLILEAASLGHPVALARCFEFGKNVSNADMRQAMTLYEASAKRGHPIGRSRNISCFSARLALKFSQRKLILATASSLAKKWNLITMRQLDCIELLQLKVMLELISTWLVVFRTALAFLLAC